MDINVCKCARRHRTCIMQQETNWKLYRVKTDYQTFKNENYAFTPAVRFKSPEQCRSRYTHCFMEIYYIILLLRNVVLIYFIFYLFTFYCVTGVVRVLYYTCLYNICTSSARRPSPGWTQQMILFERKKRQ